MDFIVKGDRDICIVSVIGDIDALTAPQLETTLIAEVKSGKKNLVLDLSQVAFMSSAGLRAILAGLKETRQTDGDLRLAAAQPGVDKVLQLSGITSVIRSYKELDEAVNSYR